MHVQLKLPFDTAMSTTRVPQRHIVAKSSRKSNGPPGWLSTIAVLSISPSATSDAEIPKARLTA